MRNDIHSLLEELNAEFDGKLISHDLNIYVEKIVGNATIISINSNAQLSAFIAYYDNDKRLDTAFLTMLAVKAGFRRFGYAQQLLEAAIKLLRRKGFLKFKLEVIKTNESAIELYTKNGFVFCEPKSELSYTMEMVL